MTKRKENYVYEIDRDDCLDEWLHNQSLYMTNNLFFEYDCNSRTGYFNIVAGIDYCSRGTGYDNMTISRHQTVCNMLDVPYFCVYLEGEIYSYTNSQKRLKKLKYYTIKYKYCNDKTQAFLDKLKSRYNLRNFTFTEQGYSDFLHILRGIKCEPISFSSDVYANYLPYTKIVRERHACFGKEIYQSDMDLILYSAHNLYKPVMIVEFKSHKSVLNCYEDVKGQTPLLRELAKRLNIPILKVWHQDKDLSIFHMTEEYGNYHLIRTIHKVEFTDKELINFFKYWTHISPS